MADRFKKFLKTWEKKDKPESSEDMLPFIKDWIDSLDKEIRKRRSDREFISELLEAASVYFTNTFTDDEKADVFIYLLGDIHRKSL